MTGRILSTVAITVAFFSGCTMIPKYNRPAAPVPETWPEGAAYGETGSEATSPLAGDLSWREFFTDDRLQKLIAMSMENNRDLRVAALNVERARAMYRITRSELLPTIAATAEGGRHVIPSSTFGGDIGAITIDQYEVNAGIASWEPDFFGRIRSLKKKALEEYLATEQACRAAQILLISEIAKTWLALAADRENLELARSTLESRRAAYDLIHHRYEVGLATRLELHQVQTQVESARVDAARFAEQVARDENALDFLAGSPVPVELYPEALTGIGPMAMILPASLRMCS